MEISVGESKSTIDSMHSQGLTLRTSMQIDTPQLPADITELGDEQLMGLFSQLTAYNNFLSTQLACAFIDERDVERELDTHESIAFLQFYDAKKTKDTMSLLKAQVSTDPKVKHLKEMHSARYNYRKLIEVMVDNVERDTALVSRELTRRTSGASASRYRGERMVP
jgi:hypothetical protein